MTGEEHYRESERLLAMTAQAMDATKAAVTAGNLPLEQSGDLTLHAAVMVELAQGHAMLALAAAQKPVVVGMINTAAEVQWGRQQTVRGEDLFHADRSRHRVLSDVAVGVPVRLRDGDECRFCGVTVEWAGRRTARTAGLHPLGEGEVTLESAVVACSACSAALRPGASLHHLVMPPPDRPEYSTSTASYLTRHGQKVEATS